MGGSVAAFAVAVIAIGVLTAKATEPVVEVQEDLDVGPLYEELAPLGSFAPSFDGAPAWAAVTYTASGGECFDVNAEWNGGVHASVGGCGFGQDLDPLLRSLSLSQATASGEELVAGSNLKTPVILAEGYVASPDEDSLYGVVAGIVDCDCVVTAHWTDGAIGSAQAVNGVFVIQRAPVSGGSAALSGVASVVDVVAEASTG